MTDLLDRAFASVRILAPDVQDDIARTILEWTGEEQPPIALTPTEEAALAVSREQARRREFATDEDVAAVWAKYGS